MAVLVVFNLLLVSDMSCKACAHAVQASVGHFLLIPQLARSVSWWFYLQFALGLAGWACTAAV